MKSVGIRSYSGPRFPHSHWIRRDTPYISVFSPNAENPVQNNSKYWHFLECVNQWANIRFGLTVKQILRKRVISLELVMLAIFLMLYEKIWQNSKRLLEGYISPAFYCLRIRFLIIQKNFQLKVILKLVWILKLRISKQLEGTTWCLRSWLLKNNFKFKINRTKEYLCFH